MTLEKSKDLSPALTRWFVTHFVIDILFALPLFFMPVKFLNLLGWATVDPITARIVAAALFGIGIESFLGRKGTRASFTAMLRLKLIWSSAAAAGLLAGVFSGDFGILPVGIGLSVIFILFNFLWLYWYRRIQRIQP